jgi:hypothetical protein
MRVLTYSGTDGDCIQVDRPQDLYPLIDWFFMQMQRLKVNKNTLQDIQSVMDFAEGKNLGNEDEVEKVSYI